MLLRGNNINKAASAVMLVMLLFIHSVKLLHSHDASHDGQRTEVVKPTADCNICSYHLSKDADAVVYFSVSTPQEDRKVFNTRKILFERHSFYSAFENRGPPSCF